MRSGWRRGIVVYLTVALLLAQPAVFPPAAQAATFAGGSGTAGDPYVIVTVDQLQAMNEDLSAHYVLGADIDASVTSTWNSGAGFVPIGSLSTNFTGVFDGGGNSISNLFIHQANGSGGGGLFGVSKGTLRNVDLLGGSVSTTNGYSIGSLAGMITGGTVESVSSSMTVSGKIYVGGLFGTVEDATISNAHASGTVTATNNAGGLAGEVYTSTFDTVSAQGSVTAGAQYAGGLIGYAGNVSIDNGWAGGDVTASAHVGGLIGYIENNGDNEITHAYATGDVIGRAYVGGLIGDNTATSLDQVHATGAISTQTNGSVDRTYIGGLVGRNLDADISNSYATSSITLDSPANVSNVGGLVGYNYASAISDSYATGAVSIHSAPGMTVLYVGGLVGYADVHTSSGVATTLTRVQAGGAIMVTSGDDAQYIGGLVGYANTGTMSDAHATGAITVSSPTDAGYLTQYIGGLIGYSASETVSNISATGTVSVTGNRVTSAPTGNIRYAGGLIGYSTGDTISNARASGDVTSNGAFVGGLIGYFDAGNLTDVSASGTVASTGTTFSTGGHVGGLLGYVYSSATITNAQATGVSVSGYSRVGGLIGTWETNGTLASAEAWGAVTASNSYAGGLIGAWGGTSITNAAAHGDVSGAGAAGKIGGLVGWAFGPNIDNVYADGNVSSTSGDDTGGLIGRNETNVSNAYAMGTVQGTGNNVGGLVGSNWGDLTNVYATGAVTGSSSATTGGLLGYNNAGVVNTSFWNTDTTGLAAGYGSGSGTFSATGLTTAQMINPFNFIDEGWDFIGIWGIHAGINNGYPHFIPPYSVIYSGNGSTGGTAPVDNQVYQASDTATGAGSGDLEKTGYSFTGWNTKADGTGIYSYFAGATIPLGAANVILYAQWTDTAAPTESVNGGAITPSGLSATGVKLNWTKATDNVSTQSALQYLVYRSSSNNIDTVSNIEANGTAIGSYAADIATLNVTGLTSGTTYYFNVIVKDEAGNKSAYAMVSVTTMAAPDTTAPTESVNGGAITTSGLSATSVTLNWTKATDNVSAQSALQYLVYQSSSNNIDTVSNIEANGTAIGGYAADIATLNVTGLTSGTTYYFNVIVKDGAGNKSAYTMKSVTTVTALDTTAPTESVNSGAITTSGLNATGVTLNWTKATDNVSAQSALQYRVYRSSSNNIDTVSNIEANGTAIGSYAADIATLNVTGLTPGTTYYFNVIVKDEAGNKSAYSVASVTTMAAPDTTAPTESVTGGAITPSGLSDTGVTLNWTKATDNASAQSALQYLVYRASSNNIDTVSNIEANGTAIGSFSADIATLNVMGLTASTTYYFNVIVKDEAGNKSAYSVASVTTMAALDTTAPTESVNSGAITTSGLSATGVKLNWTKATDNVSAQSALQYLVYRSSSSNIDTVSNIEANGTAIGSYAADIATLNVTGLTSGTTYYFNVIVKDEAGNKSAYAKVSVTTMAAPDTTAPTESVNSGAITTSGLSDTGVTLNWTKATDNVSAQSALQYLVYRSSSNNIDTVSNIEANGTAVGSFSADIATLNVTGLTASTTYYFNVIVKDEAGNESAYAMVSVTTMAALDTTAPTESVNGGAITPSGLSATGVTLNWMKATDNVSAQSALQYRVYRSSSNNIDTVSNIEANGTAIGSYAADIATLNGTGLTSGTTYYFNVIVKDEAGNKSAYTMKSVTTNAPPVIAAPTHLTATAGNAQVSLNWNSVTGAMYYNIYRGTAVGSYGTTPVATLNGATYTHTATGLTNGTTYYFAVKAGNADAVSVYSNEASATPYALSGNANLSGLTLSQGTLSPTFDPNTLNYTATVDNSVSGVKVTPTASSVSATVKVNGTVVASGSASGDIGLNVDSNTIGVEVTAQDGVTKKKYTVTVTRRSGSTGTVGSTGTGDTGSDGPGQPQDVRLIVNGKAFPQIVEIAATAENGESVLTVKMDAGKFMSLVNQEPDKALITISVTSHAGKVTVVLTGDMAKAMADKQNVLEVKTPSGIYRLPASEVAMDKWKEQFGDDMKLSDITIQVEIKPSGADKVQLTENAAKQKGFVLVSPPVAFAVTATYKGRTVSIDKFRSYVEREIPLPDGVGPGEVTTAVIVEDDGSVRYVPTRIMERGGKYYAVASSMTNSDYALIRKPASFADAAGHWAEKAVNELASRMVIGGVDGTHFRPNQPITRAEFAAIVVRALGLDDNGTSASFEDVASEAWYAGGVAKAQEYGIVSGYPDGTFHPERTITREEAIAMIVRMMKLTGMNTSVSEPEAEVTLTLFADGKSVDGWAKEAVAAAVKSGLVQGFAAGLRPKSDITRAETAAIVLRLLEKAELIG
ncbi:GLUG motif-containing protein [Cohnella silvisoli]|uniref:GLUG motif-containing protein n=1 Tax=Cohnella silvisoli TaxID=2873699 RepID=A0ABV1L411_9BACL|nr:GLUG motif-containing protein [Cohnella silvisoli]MCD9026342.1 S-layer homology domain-containing protein [Cohnella silvisoli]